MTVLHADFKQACAPGWFDGPATETRADTSGWPTHLTDAELAAALSYHRTRAWHLRREQAMREARG